VVTVDSAIALANIDLLLKLFSVPISIVVEQGGLHYQINYKVTLNFQVKCNDDNEFLIVV
ncbi:hypothetical protein C0Q89_15315, partial [Lacticaseibacillus rhamnosus]